MYIVETTGNALGVIVCQRRTNGTERTDVEETKFAKCKDVMVNRKLALQRDVKSFDLVENLDARILRHLRD